MKKLSIVALAAGILTASCSGHGGQSSLPLTSGNPNSVSRTPQTITAAPAGWANTSTQAASVANASDLGNLDASQTLTVRLGLQLHNVSQLQTLIAQGTIVPNAQFMSQFAPTSSEVSSVTSYLQSQGFTNITAEPNNMLVSADANVAQIQKAFNTSLHSFSLPAGQVFANVTPAFVPSNLDGVVVAVLGLNNAAKMVAPHSTPTDCFPLEPQPAGPCLFRNIDAKESQLVYDAGGTPAATNTTVAVMAEGNVSQTVTDLRYAETQQGLPQVPTTVITVGLPSPDTYGLIEWDLDTQSSTGIAGTVKGLYIYATTSLTDSDIANEYNHWVTQNVAKLGNSSFGECEYQAWLDGSMRIDDQVMMQAASQGQTMFASSGDTGSSCALVGTNGVPGSGPPMVEYPAASPYIVAVGGTSLFTNTDKSYSGEAAWNAGGGGLSQFENSTTWEQQGQIIGGTVAEANLRGLPDIAMAADPNSGGYILYTTSSAVCTSPCGVGGTSEASPLSMGSFARFQSTHNNAIGFAAPAFYRNYIHNYVIGNLNPTGTPAWEAVGGFRDILTGANGAYTAGPGYDYTTGLGSLDISVMNGQI
ncbi:MAG: protease pro-enzyme activation domain-containing protein [Candidatus Baltobacteraceae bacterium]